MHQLKTLQAHLQNYIRFASRKLTVSKKIYNKLLDVSDDFSLTLDSDCEVNTSSDKAPEWLVEKTYLERIYDQSEEFHYTKGIGDPALKKLTGYTHYRSFEQKLSVHTALNLKKWVDLPFCSSNGCRKEFGWTDVCLYE